MSEIKFRYKFDSTAYVVDEAYFLKIERMAKMNGEKIEKLAEKKFRNYLNDGMNPIKLEFRIRGVEELVGHSVITELNYGERGYIIGYFLMLYYSRNLYMQRENFLSGILMD